MFISSRSLGVLGRTASVLAFAVAVSACTEEATNTNGACYDPLAAGCNQGGAGGEGGSSVVPQPDTFFEGTYKTGVIEYAWAYNQEMTNAATLANAYDWAGVEAAVAPGSLLGQKLDAMELEFSTGVEAKKRSPKALIAQGLSMGKASGGDATKNDIAKQHIEKSLIVLTELYAMHEIEEALEATKADDAAREVDAAAIIWATLESRMIKRQASEVPDLWKAGSTLITTDKLAMHTGELLFAARTKIADGAPDATAALVKANVYATKYFYASVLNYGYKVEGLVAEGKSTEIVQIEGATFSEGLSTAFFGGDDAAAAELRGIWTGQPAGITVAALRPAMVGVYDKLTTEAASYFNLPENPEPKGMLESAGRIAGAIEVLTEALDASGADVVALQGKATSLIDAAKANDVSGADALAKELSAAVTAAVK